MEDEILKQTQIANWQFPIEVWNCLSDYEKSFVKNEFTSNRSLDYYSNHLISLGFNNLDCVLDAACGMGQWSIALAGLNKHITGIDINMERLLVANEISKSHNIQNCVFRYGSIEQIPYPNSSFDGIFCYGAFMFTDMLKTLQEFHRVLKPNGRLYLNANSAGWYAHLLWDIGVRNKNYQMIKTVIRSAVRTLRGRSSNRIVSRKWLKSQLINMNFELIDITEEGKININPIQSRPESCYPSRFYGMTSIIEVIAKRKEES
ncbi:class I SAM-dependent methyltransferase [Pseudanabaena minima]|uniref:class I SAM-dependent methyltransferase n=1 Tax=Pseudanabaena minima TaxID=890415 RepID=UPI003DA90EB6